jgi:ribosome recycling factor
MPKQVISSAKEKMIKAIHAYSRELASIRAGRASASLLDRITVDYYGAPTPVNQLAGISTPEARLLVIQPYDKSILNEIERAILKSDLGLNPSNDGSIIRIAIPQLTEERRKELAKVVKKESEEAKVAVRNIRRDANDDLKKNPDIEEWYIGGHSLGGAMASNYASENSEKLKGIFFLGAYPYADLSSTKLTMLSIVGSNDKVVNRKKLDSTRTNAPKGAIYKTLEGGNHANYGDYGKQSGDGRASISRDEQIEQTVEWIMEYCK